MNLCLFRNWSDPWTDTVSSSLFVSSFFDKKLHGSHHQQQLATSHPTSWISVVFRIRHEQQILCNSVVPVYHVDRFVKVQRLLRSSSPFQSNFDILKKAKGNCLVSSPTTYPSLKLVCWCWWQIQEEKGRLPTERKGLLNMRKHISSLRSFVCRESNNGVICNPREHVKCNCYSSVYSVDKFIQTVSFLGGRWST